MARSTVRRKMQWLYAYKSPIPLQWAKDATRQAFEQAMQSHSAVVALGFQIHLI
jgi:hypothetical protein